jgi:hypothetical protein
MLKNATAAVAAAAFLLMLATCFSYRMPLRARRVLGLQRHTALQALKRQEGEPLVLEGPAAYLERRKRPPPVGIPRKRMELPFAVCLMRSSYAVSDDLDFVPMVS